MRNIYSHPLVLFLSCFFIAVIIITLGSFAYLYQQVSIMSNLVSVSENGNFKIYVYFDKNIPSSSLELICVKESADVNAIIYDHNPNIFNTNGYNVGVIGRVNNICDHNEIEKWSNITWSENGVVIGNGDYFLSKHDFPDYFKNN